jgi:hypothetical protein
MVRLGKDTASRISCFALSSERKVSDRIDGKVK